MQHDRLTHLENLISHNQSRFHEIGKALKEIRDGRLYKLILFETFEAYTKARWDMGKSHTYRLIQAYQVVNNLRVTSRLSPIGDILPGNEFQVRPLVKLDPFEQRKAWKDFLSTGMEITAPNIKRFIAGSKTSAKGTPVVDLTDQISKEYMEAVLTLLEQVRIAQNDHWQKTSRQAGLLWISVIREKILSEESGNGHR
jgi:hypothetical protein